MLNHRLDKIRYKRFIQGSTGWTWLIQTRFISERR